MKNEKHKDSLAMMEIEHAPKMRLYCETCGMQVSESKAWRHEDWKHKVVYRSTCHCEACN